MLGSGLDKPVAEMFVIGFWHGKEAGAISEMSLVLSMLRGLLDSVGKLLLASGSRHCEDA